MFNIICIDWGFKRPGIAFGNLETGLIIPFNGKVENKNLIPTILKEIESRNIDKIVIGKPLNSRGEKTAVTQNVLDFKNKLETKIPKNIDIHLQDERWTSKDGSKLGFSKEDLNHFSAIKILERYLSK